MKLRIACSVAVAALAAFSTAAQAQIAVAAIDGKQLRNTDVPPGMRPDTIAVIDLSPALPKVLGTLAAPASMIGPPTAVAVAPNGRFALVSASQKANPADPTALLPDDTVSVIDLSTPASPKIIQTLHAGAGAGGVTINAAGTLALVASTAEDVISVFSISGRTLTLLAKAPLEAKAHATDVIFLPDGKRAVAVEQGLSKLEFLTIDGNKVTDSGVSVVSGRMPYGAAVSNDGSALIVANLGGAAPLPGAVEAAPPPPAAAGAPPAGGRRGNGPRRIPIIAVINLKTNTLASTVDVAATPEHVVLSPDSKYVAAVLAVNTPVDDPNFANTHGLLQVFRLDGTTLVPVATANTGHWGQGATWSKDGKTIFMECATEREIEVFHFDGTTLTQDTAATLKFDARPGAIATATSR